MIAQIPRPYSAKIHKGDDFKYSVSLVSAAGAPLKFPEGDFSLNFYTSDPDQAVSCGRVDGKPQNLEFAGDTAVCSIATAQLPCGNLCVSMLWEKEDASFPDGAHNALLSSPLLVSVWDGPTVSGEGLEAALVVPQLTKSTASGSAVSVSEIKQIISDTLNPEEHIIFSGRLIDGATDFREYITVDGYDCPVIYSGLDFIVKGPKYVRTLTNSIKDWPDIKELVMEFNPLKLLCICGWEYGNSFLGGCDNLEKLVFPKGYAPVLKDVSPPDFKKIKSIIVEDLVAPNIESFNVAEGAESLEYLSTKNSALGDFYSGNNVGFDADQFIYGCTNLKHLDLSGCPANILLWAGCLDFAYCKDIKFLALPRGFTLTDLDNDQVYEGFANLMQNYQKYERIMISEKDIETLNRWGCDLHWEDVPVVHTY